MRLVRLSLAIRLFLWYPCWGCRGFDLGVFVAGLCSCGGLVCRAAFCWFGTWCVWPALMVSDCHSGWVGALFIG
jgi:hypothetical protein